MSKRMFSSPNESGEKILNRCPYCNSVLEYNMLMQYSNVYKILNNGTLSKQRIRKEDDCSMECGFISCSNPDCDFSTDCDLDVNDDTSIHIWQDGDKLKYTIDNE